VSPRARRRPRLRRADATPHPDSPGSGLIAPNGRPGYIVLHARAGINLARNVQLTVGVENLLDEEYRTAHSRMDAARRNVMVGLRVNI
jgi:outer membrane receptor protein involved in Fe transport